MFCLSNMQGETTFETLTKKDDGMNLHTHIQVIKSRYIKIY